MPTYNEAIAGPVATTSGVIFAVDQVSQAPDTLSFPFSKIVYGTTGVANIVSTALPLPVQQTSNWIVASASSGLVQIAGVPSVVISSSAGLATIANVSASSGLVQLTSAPLVIVATSGGVLLVQSTAGTNPWSSAPGFNLPVVSASSGLVQISGVPSFVISSSAGLATITNVSASSGLVQISGVPSVVISSSAALATVANVSASSGVVQISPNTTANPGHTGINFFKMISTGNAPTQNISGVPAQLFGWNASNSTAGALALHFYNTTSSPTVGTTANLITNVLVPGSTGGAGNNMPIGAYGIFANNGLGITMTANMNDTDTGVAGNNSLAVTVYYV